MGDADADLGELGGEDVGAVAGAVHPALDYFGRGGLTCGDVLGPRLAPAAFGFLTLFFGSGQAIGPSLAGAIADAAGSFTPAFLLAAVVSLLGALGASLLRPASTRFIARRFSQLDAKFQPAEAPAYHLGLHF